MTSDVSDFVPASLLDTDIYIKVADMHFVTVKQIGEVYIILCNHNVKTFIDIIYNVRFTPDL